MSLTTLKCPHCGADIKYDTTSEFIICSRCESRIVNKNVEPENIDAAAESLEALKDALNRFTMRDYPSAETLVDRSLKYNKNCSDALYLKSAIVARRDAAAANGYLELAEKEKESAGLVSAERYKGLVAEYVKDLVGKSDEYIKGNISKYDFKIKELDQCRKHIEENIFGKVGEGFPFITELIADETEKEFKNLEKTLGSHNEITQEQWDALRIFDRKHIYTVTSLYIANPTLDRRYKVLIAMYNSRLGNGWAPIFKKCPVIVDRGELSGMKKRAKIFLKWIG